MKSYLLYLWSAAGLLLLGIALLGINWHGDAALTGAWPMSSSQFKFCGSASGPLALLGFFSLILSAISFLVSLVLVVMDRVGAARA
jgi:hypothetical protein